jgi:MFS family permease
MSSVVLLNTITTLSIVLLAIVQQPMLLEFGFPLWSLGAFVAGQMLVGAAGSYSSGPVGERVGLRGLFMVVPLVSALSLFAGVSDWPWAYAVFVAPAAGFHLVFPHASGFLARRVGEDERATVISMASSGTTVVLTPLLGLLVDRSSLDAGLIDASLGLTVVALLAYLAWETNGDLRRDPVEPSSASAGTDTALVSPADGS